MHIKRVDTYIAGLKTTLTSKERSSVKRPDIFVKTGLAGADDWRRAGGRDAPLILDVVL